MGRYHELTLYKRPLTPWNDPDSPTKWLYCQSRAPKTPVNYRFDPVNGLKQISIGRMTVSSRHCLIILDFHLAFCFLPFEILTLN